MKASLSGAVQSMIRLRRARARLADAMACDPDLNHLAIMTARDGCKVGTLQDTMATVLRETAALGVYCEALGLTWHELRPMLLNLERRADERSSP